MRTQPRLPRERPLPTRAQLAGLGLVTVLLAIAAPAAFTDQASAKAQRPPKVAEVDFFKQSGEQGPATRLEAYGRRIDSLKFKTGYAGKKAKATGAEFKPVNTHRFGHPWIPDPDNGRRALLNVMKNSIDATGAATLKVLAKNDAGRSKTLVQIRFSDCHLEPPLYPFTCIVKP